MAEAVMLNQRPANGTGGTHSNWQLARSATAFVDSLSEQQHVVFVRLPEDPDRLLWEGKRLLPLFPGWEVAVVPCVDGWGLGFRGRSLKEVMRRVNEIIQRGEFHR